MANVVHSGLTAANLHEPKGVASATTGKVYVSNGAGSGAWTTVGVGQSFALTVQCADASSATATSKDAYLTLPFACTVTNVYSVAFAAIATADNVITVSNHAGSSMGTITVAFTGSAIGDVDTITAITTNNTFAAGEKMSFVSASASATVCPMTYTVIATRTS